MLQKKDEILNLIWKLTGYNKTLMYVEVKKEAEEGGRAQSC